MTNIPHSFLRSRHVCVLSARHCLGPGDHSDEWDSLGPHGASVPGAMPPLAATVATDGSLPRVTVSACSLVLSGSLSRARHSRLCLPQAPRHCCCCQRGHVAEGVWTPWHHPHAGLEGPLCVFPTRVGSVTSGWFCPLTTLECRGVAPRVHAPVCSVVGEGTFPGVSRDHTSQAERLLPGTAPSWRAGVGSNHRVPSPRHGTF